VARDWRNLAEICERYAEEDMICGGDLSTEHRGRGRRVAAEVIAELTGSCTEKLTLIYVIGMILKLTDIHGLKNKRRRR